MYIALALAVGLIVGFGVGIGVYFYNRKGLAEDLQTWKDSYREIKEELKQYKK